MKIFKFGGAVLSDTIGFRKMYEIITNYASDKILIVISAISGSTVSLEKAARTAETGNLENALEILTKLINKHLSLSDSLLDTNPLKEEFLQSLNLAKKDICNLLKGISITHELTNHTLDKILNFGELFSLKLANYFLLEKQINSFYINATDLIVSDSNFGAAKPILELTKKNVLNIIPKYFQDYNILLSQGFVAKNIEGEITTMGLESSNLTAALFAEILDCKEIVFWTDVEGVCSADPKLCENVKTIHYLDYTSAAILSLNGLKLIHPEMIQTAQLNKITCTYKSPFNPTDNFSIIGNFPDDGIFQVILLNEKLNLLNNLEIEKMLQINSFHSNYKPLIKFNSQDIDLIALKLTNSENFSFEHELINNKTFTLVNIISKNISLDEQSFNIIRKLIPDESYIFIENKKNIEIVRILLPEEFASKLIQEVHNSLKFIKE